MALEGRGGGTAQGRGVSLQGGPSLGFMTVTLGEPFPPLRPQISPF